MGSRIEDLCSVVVGEEVYSLVDVLVEAIHFAKRLSFSKKRQIRVSYSSIT